MDGIDDACIVQVDDAHSRRLVVPPVGEFGSEVVERSFFPRLGSNRESDLRSLLDGNVIAIRGERSSHRPRSPDEWNHADISLEVEVEPHGHPERREVEVLHCIVAGALDNDAEPRRRFLLGEVIVDARVDQLLILLSRREERHYVYVRVCACV